MYDPVAIERQANNYQRRNLIIKPLVVLYDCVLRILFLLGFRTRAFLIWFLD